MLSLRNLTVSYGATPVLTNFSLELPKGQLVALLGESGSGKTTLLRALSGFVSPDSGSIIIDGVDVTGLSPEKRGIGVVFQSYALFPHLTVEGNIAYPLKVKKWKKSKIKDRVAELVSLVHLEGHEKKKPATLSGGQQQRVALARAFAMDPELLLLDEPLSNLDANLREEMGREIRRLQQSTGTTAVMVTHDRNEAFTVSDKIAVLKNGVIEQYDTPAGIYQNPRNEYLAAFAGAANFLSIRAISASDTHSYVESSFGVFKVPGRYEPGTRLRALVRPEGVTIVSHADGPQRLTGVVVETTYKGNTTSVVIANGEEWLSTEVATGHDTVPEVGDSVTINFDVVKCFPAAGSGRES